MMKSKNVSVSSSAKWKKSMEFCGSGIDSAICISALRSLILRRPVGRGVPCYIYRKKGFKRTASSC